MGEIKRVNGQILRRELQEMERLEIYYDLLEEELDKLNNIIYSHHDKNQSEISVMMLKTNEIEKVLNELGEKLNILQLFKDIENGEQEENQDFELVENGSFTTLKLVVTFKKFIHKKGGLAGSYKKAIFSTSSRKISLMPDWLIKKMHYIDHISDNSNINTAAVYLICQIIIYGCNIQKNSIVRFYQ